MNVNHWILNARMLIRCLLNTGVLIRGLSNAFVQPSFCSLCPEFNTSARGCDNDEGELVDEEKLHTWPPFRTCEHHFIQARKLQDAQAEKLTSLQASKLTS